MHKQIKKIAHELNKLMKMDIKHDKMEDENEEELKKHHLPVHHMEKKKR